MKNQNLLGKLLTNWKRDRVPLIQLSHVSKIYDTGSVTVRALDEVTLSIEEGEFVVVLGPSGCGKTTMLNLIGALDTPSEGKVTIGGFDLSTGNRSSLSQIRRNTVSFVFQSFNLFPGLTAEENVQFGLDVSGNKSKFTASHVLSDVGLENRSTHFPHCSSSIAVASSATFTWEPYRCFRFARTSRLYSPASRRAPTQRPMTIQLASGFLGLILS